MESDYSCRVPGVAAHISTPLVAAEQVSLSDGVVIV
jgi:hypothetical protein